MNTNHPLLKSNSLSIFISPEAPLSSWCQRITGDSYNSQDWEFITESGNGVICIKHKKTGFFLIAQCKASAILESLEDLPPA